MNKQFLRNIKDASPEVLFWSGITGMMTAVVMSAMATPKAVMLLQEKTMNEKEPGESGLTKKEIIETVWKSYIPTAGVALASVACLVASNKIMKKKNAAVLALYAIGSRAFDEYKEEVVKVIGEKKESSITDALMDKEAKKNVPLVKYDLALNESLFLDPLSGRYFVSSIEKIRKVQNDINHRMMSDMYLTLNEFYDEIGLEHTEMGDLLSWIPDHGLLDFRFTAKLTNNDQPCIVLHYVIKPAINK